jgi:hypothetical protein
VPLLDRLLLLAHRARAAQVAIGIARLDSGETELQASSGLRQAPFECSEEARCFTSGDGAMIESER